MLNISETDRAIADRFFMAIDYLKRQRTIRGLQTFTREHGWNYGNFCTMKNNRNIRSMKPEYLACLAADYGVSCEWLLLGRGEMFTRTHSRSEESPAP